MTATAQARIDAIAYPPTMQFRLDGLKPIGFLADRLKALDKVAPGFFDQPGTLLDVGASKGYFALRAARNASRVVAVESRPDVAAMLRDIAPDNVEVVTSTFGAFETEERFDRAWIGNAHHYCYREARGWQWVQRLGGMVKPGGELLVEGPIDMRCRDMQKNDCIPQPLQRDFTERQWMAHLRAWFDLKAHGESPSPGRRVWHLKRHRDLADYGQRVLVPLYVRMAAVIEPTDDVLEVCVRKRDRGILSREIIKCRSFTALDKCHVRAKQNKGITADVLTDPIPEVDTIISTAILHHVAPESTALLIERLCAASRRQLLLSGPDVRKQPDLYGDHLWHVDIPALASMAADNGFALTESSPSGSGDVYCRLERQPC
jgi:SAM-dependent methyltransferase